VNHWDSIRIQAHKLHRLALEITQGKASAESLLSAAAELTDIPRQGLPGTHRLLYKSKAALHCGQVWFNWDLPLWEQQFNQAHEYAHHWRHGGGAFCGQADFDAEAIEDGVRLGAKRVDGYSPHERKELEANVFAREFLLPGDRLREQFMNGRSAEDIASEVGMPTGMVFHQLTRSLLGLSINETEEASSEESEISQGYSLDDSQRSAAHAGWDDDNLRPAREQHPVLVDAGPGTGKTRALVGRIIHLLEDRGIHPSRLLALTYSNKAAEEMYSRVRAAVSQDTTHIWMGTFHAFGLELVRKYYDRLGLRAKPEIIDPLDAQLLLEQSLDKLGLRHYRHLPNPTRDLGSILGAISRAKDELKDPEDYARLADEEWTAAGDDEKARKKAARAQEVAHVYARYDELLRSRNTVDYGDLIFKAVKLLRDHKDVREKLQEKYEHILVDEYQDVNTGSRMMLKLLAGNGRGLWVVGDLRQAIYRFRGAAPVNMRLLTTEDFPDAEVVQLRGNYRSQRPIVDLFELCATRMRATTGRTHRAWEVKRPIEGGEVRYKSSADERSEAEEMVEEIERLRTENIEYRDQAILCRKHESLSLFSAALERAGIPVLYLGNFFERPEIRDLLCIISVACDGDGRALFRLAQFPEYGFSFADAQALAAHAYERQCFFPEALKFVNDAEGISEEGRIGLRLLADHFADFHFNSAPWTVLVQYLFVKSNYLRALISDDASQEKDSVQRQQQRLAIYQFLLLAYQLRDRFDNDQGDQKQHFLNYVLRLKINREETQLRQTPDWADGINAVRMLTIHASKGLEFSAVHLPCLGEGKFPSGKLPDSCPPPAGMLSDEMLDWHDEEEECLFFVAISRARDRLCISRARQYGRGESKQSRLLQLVRGALPNAIVKPIPRPAARDKRTEEAAPLIATEHFFERHLRDYLICPLKYYYRHVLKISDKRSDSPYAQSHLCVHKVWQFIEEELEAGRSIDAAILMAALDEAWKDYGPDGHAYEEDYRKDAEAMVRRTLDHSSGAKSRMLRPTWFLNVTGGVIIVRPDYVELSETPEGISLLIQDLNFGTAPEKAPIDDYFSLYDAAAEQLYPQSKRRIQMMYMSDGEILNVTVNADKKKVGLRNYEKAIQGVLRNKLPIRPTEKHCPHCPGYHICPTAEISLGSGMSA
jgi:superfamily I DNA/RNA helicase/Zn-dependent peptidase ImmA (M78 family)/CRISPR/Cas system-associated exonuclease Cas4 (RecB family)